MTNAFIIHPDTEELLKNSTILIDTNFIMDAWMFKVEFADLLAKIYQLECDIVSIRSVLIEFLGGTKDEEYLKAKINFLELIFGKAIDQSFRTLPANRTFPNNEDFLAFSRQANKFGSVDFELFLNLAKYKTPNFYLLTRNHGDFTANLFERKGFITLFGAKEVRTYCLYSYTNP
jgi:rRNA-processing protein FCF1